MFWLERNNLTDKKHKKSKDKLPFKRAKALIEKILNKCIIYCFY